MNESGNDSSLDSSLALGNVTSENCAWFMNVPIGFPNPENPNPLGPCSISWVVNAWAWLPGAGRLGLKEFGKLVLVGWVGTAEGLIGIGILVLLLVLEEGLLIVYPLPRAAGTSWLCFPSYVVITALRSWDARSTCFLTGQPTVVHL